MDLILSLFPGIDLLGRGFEAEGFAVVRGPDLIFGGDIRTFHVPAGRFDGVIAGPPCQDFSTARRAAPTGYGDDMLLEFRRVITEARPAWWLLENVPTVPDVEVPGYARLRIDLDARDFGLRQSRRRHFQYGDARGFVPLMTRGACVHSNDLPFERCCMASEGSRPGRRSWTDFCELQGLSRDFDLPGFTLAARYRAVGNGVPVPMARAIAAAIRAAARPVGFRLCACGCARIVAGRRGLATAACRKRMQRRRDRAAVKGPGAVTPTRSRVTRQAEASRRLSPLAGDPPAGPCLGRVTVTQFSHNTLDLSPGMPCPA